ncbi:hypothetical protein BH23GEM3_BH23GEM3_15340 [soil metagenome]
MAFRLQASLPSDTAPAAYQSLVAALREAGTLGSAVAVLSWDQETMMPARGAELRAEQLALLSTLVHQRRTDPRIGEWLDASEADTELAGDPAAAANLREIRREYERATKLPDTLVREMAQTFSLAMEVWKGARERSDFSAFAPWLEKVVALNRTKAECLGAGSPAEMYDMLLAEYEPGASSAEIQTIFDGLRARLAPLIAAVAGASTRPDASPHHLRIPVALQEAFNRRVAEQLGYDLTAGRLDVSTHPFCQNVGPGDTRTTTRYR